MADNESKKDAGDKGIDTSGANSTAKYMDGGSGADRVGPPSDDTNPYGVKK